MTDADYNQAHGGKTVYGACVGILMLETRFPRIPGDIGHAATWPFPVIYKVVRGATGERVTDLGRSCAGAGFYRSTNANWRSIATSRSPHRR